MDIWSTLSLASCVLLLGSRAVWCERALQRARFMQRSEAELLSDYLCRQDLRIDWDKHDISYLAGGVVFVIGGGGTIGAQLAQELSRAGYHRLVLIDSDENGLYRVGRRLLELGHRRDALRLELTDVRDRVAVEHLFATHRPTAVFHYANYKSAVLGESSARAFVRVNVAGISTLLDVACRTSSVDTFVYISSDKAERASTTYGRTKRVCEMLVRAAADADNGAGDRTGNPQAAPIRFATMRYCNVLDAAGSFAIPAFRDQINAGGRITIRRMPDGSVPNRYFVDIRTAAQTALLAGAHAGQAEVFSLNSEQIAPIGIDEVAQMVARAAGVRDRRRWFRRNVQYVAAAAGEKASELLGHGSAVPASPLVKLSAPAATERVAFLASVGELLAACDQFGNERPALLLESILRTYDPAYAGAGLSGTRAAGGSSALRVPDGEVDAFA
jgi:FlaA1/EpsC-like NDP-sugar epimerase